MVGSKPRSRVAGKDFIAKQRISSALTAPRSVVMVNRWPKLHSASGAASAVRVSSPTSHATKRRQRGANIGQSQQHKHKNMRVKNQIGHTTNPISKSGAARRPTTRPASPTPPARR